MNIFYEKNWVKYPIEHGIIILFDECLKRNIDLKNAPLKHYPNICLLNEFSGNIENNNYYFTIYYYFKMDNDLIELINELIEQNPNKDEYRKRFNRIINAVKSRVCSLCNEKLNHDEYTYNIDNDFFRCYNQDIMINKNKLICSKHWCQCMPESTPHNYVYQKENGIYVCKYCKCFN
jgi:hypothetical protein